jgi:hypothetical protein
VDLACVSERGKKVEKKRKFSFSGVNLNLSDTKRERRLI